jgi:alternate signal-mediated exported protein
MSVIKSLNGKPFDGENGKLKKTIYIRGVIKIVIEGGIIMRRVKKSLPAIALAAVLLITVIGGTFAYFSQTDTADNYISVKDYNSRLEENFDPPPDGLTPEIEVAKEVGVRNTGEIPMIVRMTYTEYWDAVENAGLVLADPDGDDMYNGDADNSSLVRKWAGTGATGWLYGGDGYYYYMDVLAPGDVTDLFITAIELKDAAVVNTTLYSVTIWDDSADDFVTTTGLTEAAKDALIAGITAPDYLSQVISNTTSTLPGGKDYRLTITTETLQAVSEAAATWTPSVVAVQTLLAGITP